MIVSDYKITMDDEMKVYVHIAQANDVHMLMDALPEFFIEKNKLVIDYKERGVDKLILKNLDSDAARVIKNRLEIYINEVNLGLNPDDLSPTDMVLYPCYKRVA
jgi:hypothetical protein